MFKATQTSTNLIDIQHIEFHVKCHSLFAPAAENASWVRKHQSMPGFFYQYRSNRHRFCAVITLYKVTQHWKIDTDAWKYRITELAVSDIRANNSSIFRYNMMYIRAPTAG